MKRYIKLVLLSIIAFCICGSIGALSSYLAFGFDFEDMIIKTLILGTFGTLTMIAGYSVGYYETKYKDAYGRRLK